MRLNSTLLPLLIPLLPLTAGWEQPPRGRLRLTETSVTETGRDQALRSVKLQTIGYGLGYASPWGVGLAYTMLATEGADRGNAVRFRHQYLDATYTLGTTYLLTAGGGTGVGSARRGSSAATDVSVDQARSLFIGPGVAIGRLELYWIYRRNWVVGQRGGERHALASQHYQLGVGAQL